jgi:hypothetical protein
MKTLTAIILSVVLVTTVYSQESKTRDYALSFGIGNNFTLTNFNMDIAVKEILKDGDQIRLFLSPRVNTHSQETSTSNISTTSESDNNSYTLGLGADYLFKILSKDDFDMYGGGGLYSAFGNDGDSKNINKYPNGNSTTSEVTAPTWGVGIRGVLGVEWRASDRVGIHCEYLALATYYWKKVENKQSSTGTINPVTSTTKISTFNLGSRVVFGLSIYL